jgi:hypothetical protein
LDTDPFIFREYRRHQGIACKEKLLRNEISSEVVQADYLAKTPESSREEEAHLMRYIHLTESDIMDKSKADNFVKILWIWEILRLVVEIVVRAFRDLPITQLEIITVSFAAVSLLTVVIQTKKPKDVSEPMHFQIGTQSLTADAEGAPWRFNGTPTIGSLCHTFLRASNGFLDLTAAEFEWMGDKILDFNGLQADRVPNDYYRGTKEDEGLFFAMLSLSTVIFGAIHCGAWTFDFPTVVEKWAWRGCAVAGLVLPVVLLMLTFALNARAQNLRTAFDDAKKTFVDTLDEVERLRGRKNRFSSDFGTAQAIATKIFKDVELEHTRSKIPISAELSSAIADLADRAGPSDETRHVLFQWMRVCQWAQYPGFVIYLLTRLVLIGISLSCFRSAPRGIYWGTWANFLPAIR